MGSDDLLEKIQTIGGVFSAENVKSWVPTGLHLQLPADNGKTTYWLVAKYRDLKGVSGEYATEAGKGAKGDFEKRAAEVFIRTGYRKTEPINRLNKNIPCLPMPAGRTWSRATDHMAVVSARITRTNTLHICHIVDNSLIMALFEDKPPDDLTHGALPCFLGSAAINLDRDVYEEKVREARDKALRALRTAKGNAAGKAAAWLDAANFAMGLYSRSTYSKQLEGSLEKAARIIVDYAAEKTNIRKDLEELRAKALA